jgi:uncharacterized protein YydD (DUF2326 family)
MYMVTKKENPTNQDILTAINDFANYVQGRFDDIEARFEGVDARFDGIGGRFEGIEQRLDRVEATMVTKDYLDEKLADLRGDLVVLVRKEDAKLTKLIDLLSDKKVLSSKERAELTHMEPFTR